MMKFDTYRLLTESLGMYNLGVRPVQSLGIQSNRPGIGEGGFPPELSAKKGKGKPPFGGGEEDGPPGVGGEESPPFGGEESPPFGGEESPPFGGEGDEIGSEEGGLGGEMGGEMGGSIEDRIAELEDALEALKAAIGADGAGDENADLDHADDLGGDLEGGDEGEEGDIPDLGGEDSDIEDGDVDHEDGEDDGEEGEDNPFAKKGEKKFMRKMKSGDDDKGKGKGKGGPSFLMKKKCGADNMKGKNVILGKSKKCDDSSGSGGGMMPMKKCKKCDAKMKKKIQKETTGYERPAAFDNSEAAWLQSIRNQLASTDVRKKHNDGMRKFTNEDLLLPPPGGGLEAVPEAKTKNPENPDDLGYTAEAVQDILNRLARLERRN